MSADDAAAPQPPRLLAIHVAKGRRLPMRSIDEVTAEAGAGLVGDRYHGSRHRHVTVQDAASLAAAADELGRPVPPSGTRRNLTLSAGPVPTKPGQRLTIGEVELEVVRVAAPCRILDDELGPGAAAALRRRAGTVCRILGGGVLRVGDPAVLPPAEPAG